MYDNSVIVKVYDSYEFSTKGEIEEDEMDEETEEDAIERIKGELVEQFDEDVSQVEGVQVSFIFSYLILKIFYGIC